MSQIKTINNNNNDDDDDDDGNNNNNNNNRVFHFFTRTKIVAIIPSTNLGGESFRRLLVPHKIITCFTDNRGGRSFES